MDSIQRTTRAARFLLGVAGLMVQASARAAAGDGECTVLVTNHEVEGARPSSPRQDRRLRFVVAQELRTSLREAGTLKPEVVSALPSPAAQHTTPGRDHRRFRSSSTAADTT